MSSPQQTELQELSKKFQTLQSEIQELQNQKQNLVAQASENKMVEEEFKLCKDDTVVYKLIGPVLAKNSLEDARTNVKHRLDLIQSQLTKIEKKIEEKTDDIRKVEERAIKVRQQLAAAASTAIPAPPSV